jgi:hypothetical protein
MPTGTFSRLQRWLTTSGFYESQKKCHLNTNPTTVRDAYIQTRYGSRETGLRAIQTKAAIPIVTQKRAETKDRKLCRAKIIGSLDLGLCTMT